MNEIIASKVLSQQTIDPDFRIKVIGVGGAGSNALDRLVLDEGIPFREAYRRVGERFRKEES